MHSSSKYRFLAHFKIGVLLESIGISSELVTFRVVSWIMFAVRVSFGIATGTT